MSEPRIALAEPELAPRWAELVLRSIPEWFGIESATQQYIRDAGVLPTWVALHPSDESHATGFLTVRRHYHEAAEVHCMAVHREWHGRGVGTAMLHQVERELRAQGVQYLQVKTQGPSRPCAAYSRTLHFYRTRGFSPLEEISGLWPGIPCLVLVKRL